MRPHFIKFTFIGGINTLFAVLLWYILIEILTINLYISYSMTFIITVFISYAMNIYFNYDIKFKFGKLYIHYSIYGASFLLGVVMLALLDMIDVPLSDFHKALLTIPVRFLMNFFLVDRNMRG